MVPKGHGRHLTHTPLAVGRIEVPALDALDGVTQITIWIVNLALRFLVRSRFLRDPLGIERGFFESGVPRNSFDFGLFGTGDELLPLRSRKPTSGLEERVEPPSTVEFFLGAPLDHLAER